MIKSIMEYFAWIKAKYFHRYELIKKDLVRDSKGLADYSKHGEPGEFKLYKCKKCGLNKSTEYYPYSDVVYTRIWRDK